MMQLLRSGGMVNFEHLSEPGVRHNLKYSRPMVWEITDMKKPHLLIIEETNGTPIRGGCSSCKDVIFDTSSCMFAREHKRNLEDQFREHFRNAHECGDTEH